MKIPIGVTTSNKKVHLDLAKLVDTRMLVAANSGGGKSWLFRLIAERTAGKVQVIILDHEGEFVTLREKVDFLLVGQDGELATEIKTAKLLARKIMEAQASTIIDLYDLKLDDRRIYVREFLSSLMTLPRKFWHPLLVMVDEAHIYCPERTSSKSDSTEAVISLLSQGRKRGYAGLISTQRLSKLHKDAAAETNNVMIGRCWLDNDQLRAGDILGYDKKDRNELKDFQAGEFVAFGPAFDHAGVLKLRTDDVGTTHPKSGERHTMEVPPATEAITRVLEVMGDLPSQAQEEEDRVASLQGEILDLRRQLAQSKQQKPETRKVVERIEVPVLPNGQVAQLSNIVGELKSLSDNLLNSANGLATSLTKASQMSKSKAVVMETNPQPRIEAAETPAALADYDNLEMGPRRILTALAQHGALTKKSLSIITGYSFKSGTFSTYLSRCSSAGLMQKRGDDYEITDLGIESLGSDWQALPQGYDLINYWMREKLGAGEGRIFKALVDVYPQQMEKEELALASDLTATSGTFNTYLSRLRSLRLIEGSQELKASDELFELA